MRNEFKNELYGFCLELALMDDPDLIEVTRRLVAIIDLEYEKCINEMTPDVKIITNIINL